MTKEEIITILRENKDTWGERYGITKLILFGSIASGTSQDSSDIDLIYEKEKERRWTYQIYLSFIEELEELLERQVDLVYNDVMDPIVRYYAQDSMIEI